MPVGAFFFKIRQQQEMTQLLVICQRGDFKTLKFLNWTWVHSSSSQILRPGFRSYIYYVYLWILTLCFKSVCQSCIFLRTHERPAKLIRNILFSQPFRKQILRLTWTFWTLKKPRTAQFSHKQTKTENRITERTLMVPWFLFFFPKDPNADTEWNDILRRKGILPPKEEPKEDEEEEQALKQQSIGKTDCLVSLWPNVLPKCWRCILARNKPTS